MVRAMKVLRIIFPVSLVGLLLSLFFLGKPQLDGLSQRLTNNFQQSSGHYRAYTGSILGWLRTRPSDFSFKQHSQSPPADTALPPPIKLAASDRPPPVGSGIRSGHLITKAYKSALKDIQLAVFTLTNHHPIFSAAEFKAGTLGIPGTDFRSNEERETLQRWLDCTSGEGEWRWQSVNDQSEPRTITVHKQGPLEAKCDRAFYEQLPAVNRSGGHDGWNVRPSLKFRWYPSSRCDNIKPREISKNQPLSRLTLCRLLRHKSTLIVGDVSQYSLHDLLLDWTSTEQVSCAGNLYCKIHPICSNESGHLWESNSSQLEAGELDSHVYFKIPTPNYKQSLFASNATSVENPSSPSTPRARSTGRRTFLRYRRSDSLWGSSSPSHDRFLPIWLHPNNGIRDVNNFWYGDVRKSDLIILSRRPLGLPQQSHMSKAFFHHKHLPFHHLEYLRKHSRSQVWSTEPRLAPKNSDGTTAAVSLIKMAIKMVLEVWLPEVLFTLTQLQKSHRRADRLIVWRGEWRIHGDCLSAGPGHRQKPKHEFDWARWWKAQQGDSAGDGNHPHPAPPDLLSILFPTRRPFSSADDGDDTARTANKRRISKRERFELENPGLVFHNLQVIFQNQLMRKLAPEFGIPFLDLESQASVWRTGLLASPMIGHHQTGPSDCFHYCFPSPGLTLEESFLGGIMKILLVAGWHNSTGNGSAI